MHRLTLRRLVSLVLLLTAWRQATADSWPQWRGAHRDGQVPAFKEPAQWPPQPERLWQVEVGIGHSSPVVVGDCVYVFTRQDEEEVIACRKLSDGAEIWRQSYPAPYQINSAANAHGKGPKSTPTIAGGRVFTLGIGGILSCWEAETGKKLWQHDFAGQYKSTSPLYGAAMSPLVEGELCIVHVGGHDQGALTAFRVASGEVAWSWNEDGPSYASPIIAALSDIRQIISQSQTACVGVNLADGKLLWRIPFTTDYDQNAVTPLAYEESLILSGFNQGVLRYRVEKIEDQWSINELWENKEVSLYMSSPVVCEGRLFGFSHRQKGQLFALDVTTGRTLWTGEGRLAENAAVLCSPKVIWALTSESELIAFRDSEKEFAPLLRCKVATTPTWAHPVILPTGILIKDQSTLALWQLPKEPQVVKPAEPEVKKAALRRAKSARSG